MAQPARHHEVAGKLQPPATQRLVSLQGPIWGVTMDGASWKQELQQCSGQRSSLGGAIRNKSTPERANRLTEIIVLILFATAGVVLLVSATLALVNLNLPEQTVQQTVRTTCQSAC